MRHSEIASSYKSSQVCRGCRCFLDDYSQSINSNQIKHDKFNKDFLATPGLKGDITDDDKLGGTAEKIIKISNNFLSEKRRTSCANNLVHSNSLRSKNNLNFLMNNNDLNNNSKNVLESPKE